MTELPEREEREGVKKGVHVHPPPPVHVYRFG